MSREEFREKWARYMASREWFMKRRAVMARAQGMCERGCGAPADDVHHMTYIRRFRECLYDLLAVCRPCHQWLSGLSDEDPRLAFLRSLYFNAGRFRYRCYLQQAIDDYLIANPQVVDHPDFSMDALERSADQAAERMGAALANYLMPIRGAA